MGAITRAAANNFTTGGVILPAGINDTSVASLTELENVAAGGAMTLISEQTASGSTSIDFTSGIDSTYPIYKFEWINLHSSNDDVFLEFNLSTDGGSNYNVTKTTTVYRYFHFEDDSATALSYSTGSDLAQSTSDQYLAQGIGNANDESTCGRLFIFNPSSTVFVKHFISVSQTNHGTNDASYGWNVGGYGNTTSAINAVKFDLSVGTLDSGTIKLYGIKDS